jgi:arylsulfatase
MQLKKTLFSKSPFTAGLTTSCSALALTACLAAGSAQAADQGARHHAKGQYDTVTATYGVVEGDELIVISERFQVPVDTLKEQNKLRSDEIKPGQKLTIAASTGSPASAAGGKPNILFIMGDDIGWMQPRIYH